MERYMQLEKKINKKIKITKLSKGNSNKTYTHANNDNNLPDYSLLNEMNNALQTVYKGLIDCGHNPTAKEIIDLIFPNLDGRKSELVEMIKFHDDFANEDSELNKAITFWVDYIIKTQR